MRRRPVGVVLAWLVLLESLPVVGAIIYLSIGENRLSDQYIKRFLKTYKRYDPWRLAMFKRSQAVDATLPPQSQPVYELAQAIDGLPVQHGNHIDLITQSSDFFDRLKADIDTATLTCHLQFYIWANGGQADDIRDALIGASARGVTCKVMVDAMGSRDFLGNNDVEMLEAADVSVATALPVGFLGMWFSRADLRNHRKIAVIDEHIGYSGSQNLADAQLFKQDEDLGHWVDAMLRIEGPAVEGLARTFMIDWESVTEEKLDDLEQCHREHPLPVRGSIPVQVVPSGPTPRPLSIQQLILTIIYAAKRELIVTTPYFVPDDAVLAALVTASMRGVDVTLIIPGKTDSRLVKYAGHALFSDLLDAGVKIAVFNNDLLHTKSISVDGEFYLLGSLNLDMRSLWLNFEISLCVYDRDACQELRKLQMGYLDRSKLIDTEQWKNRPLPVKFAENIAHLAAPLL